APEGEVVGGEEGVDVGEFAPHGGGLGSVLGFRRVRVHPHESVALPVEPVELAIQGIRRAAGPAAAPAVPKRTTWPRRRRHSARPRPTRAPPPAGPRTRDASRAAAGYGRPA